MSDPDHRETVTFSHHVYPPAPVPHGVHDVDQDEWVESPVVEPTIHTKGGATFRLHNMTEHAVRDLIFKARTAPEGGRNDQWATLHIKYPPRHSVCIDLNEIEAVSWRLPN